MPRRRPSNKNKSTYYQKRNKRKPRHKALRGRADTFIEKVAQRIAKKEISKNKEQRYLVYVQKGFLHAPIYDTSANGEYVEPYVDAQGVVDHTPLYGQDIMVYPKIRSIPKDVQIDFSDQEKVTTQAGNQKICYIDGNEWGYGRTGDSVMVKSFKIVVEIEPDIRNVSNSEVQLDLLFFEAPPTDTVGKKTSFAQYIMPSNDQKALCSTRMIRDILGSSGINATNPLVSATPDISATIKKLLLKKTWILKPRSSIKEVNGEYEMIQQNIKNEFFIPINKKVEYTRGQSITGGGIRKHTGLPISTTGTAGIGQEKLDSFNNRKYYCMVKSNQSAPPVGYAPKVKLIVTTYFENI